MRKPQIIFNCTLKSSIEIVRQIPGLCVISPLAAEKIGFLIASPVSVMRA